MLIIETKPTEYFNEETDTFIKIDKQILKIEHSLISISKWESKWGKPFLTDAKKTREELLDYIQCMIINPVQNEYVVQSIPNKEINKIVDYINAPMTATTVTFLEDNHVKRKKETITSELIYYWMISAGIPFECEKWHINRLFALLKICSAKNQPKKKSDSIARAKSQAALNAKRRAKLKSRG